MFFAAVHYAHTIHIEFPGGWRASGIVDLSFAGGSLLPLLFFAPWLWRRREWLAGGVILLGGLLVTFRLWSNVGLNSSAPDLLKHWGFLVQAVLLAAGGLHLLLLVAAETWRRRDIVTLILVVLDRRHNLFCNSFELDRKRPELSPPGAGGRDSAGAAVGGLPGKFYDGWLAGVAADSGGGHLFGRRRGGLSAGRFSQAGGHTNHGKIQIDRHTRLV